MSCTQQLVMTHNLIIELDLKLLDAERCTEKKLKAVEVHASGIGNGVLPPRRHMISKLVIQ